MDFFLFTFLFFSLCYPFFWGPLPPFFTVFSRLRELLGDLKSDGIQLDRNLLTMEKKELKVTSPSSTNSPYLRFPLLSL